MLGVGGKVNSATRGATSGIGINAMSHFGQPTLNRAVSILPSGCQPQR
jgi:hypothetical protein